MTLDEIKKMIHDSDYWDCKVCGIQCDYFADEVTISYDSGDGQYFKYNFISCYKINFEHHTGYDKMIQVKHMIPQQIPYYLQEISVEETQSHDKKFLAFKINMYPLNIEIWCEHFEITSDTV